MFSKCLSMTSNRVFYSKNWSLTCECTELSIRDRYKENFQNNRFVPISAKICSIIRARTDFPGSLSFIAAITWSWTSASRSSIALGDDFRRKTLVRVSYNLATGCSTLISLSLVRCWREGQPRSWRSSFSSLSSSLRTLSAPASPPRASPYATGRPNSTPDAPSIRHCKEYAILDVTCVLLALEVVKKCVNITSK